VAAVTTAMATAAIRMAAAMTDSAIMILDSDGKKI
jgi:hypothetical protein